MNSPWIQPLHGHTRKRPALGTQTDQSHLCLMLRTFQGCALKPRGTLLAILHAKPDPSFPGITQLCRGFRGTCGTRITGLESAHCRHKEGTPLADSHTLASCEDSMPHTGPTSKEGQHLSNTGINPHPSGMTPKPGAVPAPSL